MLDIIILISIMSTFEQNLSYFKQRQPNFLINIIIGKQEYQLQVTKKHKVSSIIDRFKRNGFLNAKEQDKFIAIMGGTRVDSNKIVQELIAQNQGKQITLQLIKEEAQEKNVKKAQMPNKKAEPKALGGVMQQEEEGRRSFEKMVEYSEQSIVKNFSNLSDTSSKKQPTITPKQLQKLITQIQNRNEPIIGNLGQFENILRDKLSGLRFNNILRMIQIANQRQFEERLPNLSPEEKQIQNKFVSIKLKLASYQNLKNFIDQLLKKLENTCKEFNINFQTQSKIKNIKKNRSEIGNNNGQVQNTVLGLADKLIEVLKENSKKNEQKNIEYMKTLDKLKNCERQVQFYKQQIRKLTQIIDALKQKTTENSAALTYSQYKQDSIKIITHFMNRKIYQKEVAYLFQSIQNYQKVYIRQFQSILSLRKGQMPFQVMSSFLESLKTKYTRVLILVGTESGSFMSFYSTLGVNKLAKVKDYGKKIKNQNQQSSQRSGCLVKPGFFVEVNKKKIFYSANNQTQMITYDEKFLYLAYCFQMMVNMKKKLEIQFKQLKKKQLIDDRDELYQFFENKKKVQVTHLEIFRVFLTRNEAQKKSQMVRSIESTSISKGWNQSL